MVPEHAGTTRRCTLVRVLLTPAPPPGSTRVAWSQTGTRARQESPLSQGLPLSPELLSVLLSVCRFHPHACGFPVVLGALLRSCSVSASGLGAIGCASQSRGKAHGGWAPSQARGLGAARAAWGRCGRAVLRCVAPAGAARLESRCVWKPQWRLQKRWPFQKRWRFQKQGRQETLLA